MSLDPLFVAAAVGVGPAAGLVLWTSSGARHSARAFRAARRLLLGALLLALLLAAIATFRWSHATMGTTASEASPAASPAARPPLAGFVVLAALAWLALAVALRRRSDGRSRLGIRRRAHLEERPPLGLVGHHAVPVPGARVPAGSAVVPPAVPTGCRERPPADHRVGAEPA
ncbi:hypothetical protein [Streptacidiphilus jiangxiensis]|uniref:hypothetical protein n=1 Tax=Streptacidiphilus jiangxiensis TaxID=235985 RepID=UPI001FD44546|nr:hypothetical protein [Streptacidiphilus jiangxiensis]